MNELKKIRASIAQAYNESKTNKQEWDGTLNRGDQEALLGVT